MTKMEMNDIIESINNEDSKSFVAVSGVGNKLANRIINELKEKIKKNLLELLQTLILLIKIILMI